MTEYSDREILANRIITVDPDTALKMLETNKTNRKISWSRVLGFVNDMKRGAWRLTHQGIAVNAKGDLIDGQHRLWAVAESGTTQRFYCTKYSGDDSAMMMPLDMGGARTTADRTPMVGREVAVVKQLCSCLYGTYLKLGDDEVVDIWEEMRPYDKTTAMGRKYFSAAAIRGAVILRSMNGFNWSDQYNAMIHDSFQEMHPMTISLYHKILEQTELRGSRTSRTLYALTWYASDPKRKDGKVFRRGFVEESVEEGISVMALYFPGLHKALAERAKGGGKAPMRVAKHGTRTS